MDPSKVTQQVDPEKLSSVDGGCRHSPPSTVPVDAVSKVLDDDDLLPLIILRVGFPTSLVRAALVCKRWLCLLSDIAFLSSFRELHLPRVLGFFVEVCSVDSVPSEQNNPRFIPMQPLPTELATVARRLDAYVSEATRIHGRRDRNALLSGFWTSSFIDRAMDAIPSLPQPIPPLPQPNSLKSIRSSSIQDKEEGHGFSCTWSLMESNGNEVCTMTIYTLRDGFWHMHPSATTHLTYRQSDEEPLLVESTVYMRRVTEGDILVWDLTASSFFTIQLPEGAEHLHSYMMLSRANDSEVHLTHVKKFHLRIWLHNGENWLLVCSICLHRFCPVLTVPDRVAYDEQSPIIRIGLIGDRDNSFFLKIGQYVLYILPPSTNKWMCAGFKKT